MKDVKDEVVEAAMEFVEEVNPSAESFFRARLRLEKALDAYDARPRLGSEHVSGDRPTLDEVLAQAMGMTLLDALSHVATWESERAVAQALRGERDPHTGALWDTCFRYAFEVVLASREPGEVGEPAAVSKASAPELTLDRGSGEAQPVLGGGSIRLIENKHYQTLRKMAGRALDGRNYVLVRCQLRATDEAVEWAIAEIEQADRQRNEAARPSGPTHGEVDRWMRRAIQAERALGQRTAEAPEPTLDRGSGDPQPIDDSLFHSLWTKAVGLPGYDKHAWLALEKQVHAGLRSEAARPVDPICPQVPDTKLLDALEHDARRFGVREFLIRAWQHGTDAGRASRPRTAEAQPVQMGGPMDAIQIINADRDVWKRKYTACQVQLSDAMCRIERLALDIGTAHASAPKASVPGTCTTDVGEWMSMLRIEAAARGALWNGNLNELSGEPGREESARDLSTEATAKEQQNQSLPVPGSSPGVPLDSTTDARNAGATTHAIATECTKCHHIYAVRADLLSSFAPYVCDDCRVDAASSSSCADPRMVHVLRPEWDAMVAVVEAARTWLFACDQPSCERKASCSDDDGSWSCEGHRGAHHEDLRRRPLVLALERSEAPFADLGAGSRVMKERGDA